MVPNRFFILSLVSFSLASLGLAEHSPGRSAGQLIRKRAEAKQHFVNYEGPKIEVVDGCQLPEGHSALLNRLNSGQPVAFHELTDVFLKKQLIPLQGKEEQAAALRELNIFLATLQSKVVSRDPHQIKEEYEEALASKFSGTKTLYNLEARSIVDICRENKLQCYSGTSLNQVITRTVLGMHGFRRLQSVVIHEEGHVLPGYVVDSPEGARLFGIETTARGPAKLEYGLLKELKRNIRVVDSEDWLISEIFNQCMKNKKAYAEAVLEKSAKKYSFVSRPMDPNEVGQNGSVFGFGQSKTPAGDLPREFLSSAKVEGPVVPRIDSVRVSSGSVTGPATISGPMEVKGIMDKLGVPAPANAVPPGSLAEFTMMTRGPHPNVPGFVYADSFEGSFDVNPDKTLASIEKLKTTPGFSWDAQNILVRQDDRPDWPTLIKVNVFEYLVRLGRYEEATRVLDEHPESASPKSVGANAPLAKEAKDGSSTLVDDLAAAPVVAKLVSSEKGTEVDSGTSESYLKLIERLPVSPDDLLLRDQILLRPEVVKRLLGSFKPPSEKVLRQQIEYLTKKLSENKAEVSSLEVRLLSGESIPPELERVVIERKLKKASLEALEAHAAQVNPQWLNSFQMKGAK